MAQRRLLEKRKYPVADELVTTIDPNEPLTHLPKPMLKLKISDSIAGEAIALWDFLYRFRYITLHSKHPRNGFIASSAVTCSR
jgi:hypothetical protein